MTHVTPASIAFLVASNPALANTGSAEWDDRLAEYLRLDALTRADLAFGPFGDANEKFEWTKYSLEHKYGTSFERDPRAAAEWSETFDRLHEAEQLHFQARGKHSWLAACELCLTPAPNLSAALFKIEVIKREERDCFEDMPRDPMELVQEDMDRLRKESVA
ncbi:hypothetical protein ACFO0A_00650 [Novosphingobium tardum]|uniref:Secreted protein n=1 Tax=Novosphingobium tardum TaxID=1538021 RepID=A0ABV8RM27_9SPHN